MFILSTEDVIIAEDGRVIINNQEFAKGLKYHVIGISSLDSDGGACGAGCTCNSSCGSGK